MGCEERGHYNWHRYYDPSIGRYISADPIGQGGGINVYQYVENIPTMGIDPSGLFSIGDALADSAIGRAVAAIPVDGKYAKCLADCIDNNSLGAAGLLPVLGSRLPKEALPPFRSIPTGASGAGGTTILSSAAGVASRRGLISSSTRGAIRGLGRALSQIATPLTVAEGAYSYGLIGYCATKCKDPGGDCSVEEGDAP